MAGWSKRVDGSGLECLSALDKPEEELNSEVGFKVSSKEVEGEKISEATGHLFIELLSQFLKEVYGPQCFRPIPPMLGDEEKVDLFKLYTVVRDRGGYRAVSRNGLWSLVAKECGYHALFGVRLKLIYVKYLDSLERWLESKTKELKGEEGNIGLGVGGMSMDMESDFKNIIEKFLEMKDIVNSDLKNANAVEKELDGSANERPVTVERNISVQRGRDGSGSASTLPKEDDAGRKRKQESCLDMLNWVIKVAKDPCDPSIMSLPDVSKWKSYGTDKVWKQVLLLRESMLLKRNTDSSQHSIWQKMHPTMYEDKTPVSERVRCSQRLLVAKEDSFKKRRIQSFTPSSSTSVQSDEDHTDTPTDSTDDSDVGRWWNQSRRKKTPAGRNFQADIPEWTGEVIESDSKYLGTQTWPLPKGEKCQILIERDPIGKGRQDTCGCQIPGSYKCVKFHIAEKRSKLKCELGSAFYLWKLDCAGEEVAMSWTNEEEKKYEEIVKSGSQSHSKSFWDEIFKQFPRKCRDSLVSYHFNVFLLRRRGNQNRLTPTEIDSDDDELQYGPRANSFGRSSDSIFCSPKKVPK